MPTETNLSTTTTASVFLPRVDPDRPAFGPFARLVADRLDAITGNGAAVFATTATKDDLWAAYLGAFPDGTNPIFRERTEHDCSCCRQFIKGLGGIVTLRADGTYQTVWDVDAEGFFGVVADAMAEFIRSHPIDRVFRTQEGSFGAEATIEDVEGSPPINWSHFHGRTPAVCKTATPGEAIGAMAAAHQVFGRGLTDLSLGALEVVEDLIGSNSLYRGEEHAAAVTAFASLKRQFDAADGARRDNFVWMHLDNRSARFRNTVIGTLVTDISEGMGIEQAVGRFEAKVAPQNYKRSSAPITKGMIDRAVGTLRDLGLESALQRRHATVSDVSVNDVLFVDRSVRPAMRDALSDLLMAEVAPQARAAQSGAQDIPGDDFMANVLPGATSVALHLDNGHLGNFVSITAPAEDDVRPLLQWGNNFAWAYDGDIADSMKQRVKRAGGNVDAWLRVSLGWFNYDDLDIHCQTPAGDHIYYGNMRGILDVDMNAGGARSREAVENLAFTRCPDGAYRVWVHQYAKRESIDVGFEIEYEHKGDVRRASYGKALRQGENVEVMVVTAEGGQVSRVAFADHMRIGSASTEKWGVQTGAAVPVDTVMLSPNHWGGGAGQGNKHHVFVLRGCLNPDPVRGFFNEFLRSDLHEHRKVFEVLGGKTKCAYSEDQLSGVGFSSTRHDRATFTVSKNDATRTYNVQF